MDLLKLSFMWLMEDNKIARTKANEISEVSIAALMDNWNPKKEIGTSEDTSKRTSPGEHAD